MTFQRRHARRLLTAAVLGLGLALSAPATTLASDPGATQSTVKIGDTPADFAQPVATPKIGDTPVDGPGASRAPRYDPPTVEVVRPERTIVREVDEALPIVVSGLALLVALGGTSYAVVGTRSVRRGVVGRPH